MAMIRVLLLVSLSVFVSPSSAGAAMELGQFIKSILTEQRKGLLPWSFQAQPDSPVQWQTDGIT